MPADIDEQVRTRVVAKLDGIVQNEIARRSIEADENLLGALAETTRRTAARYDDVPPDDLHGNVKQRVSETIDLEERCLHVLVADAYATYKLGPAYAVCASPSFFRSPRRARARVSSPTPPAATSSWRCSSDMNAEAAADPSRRFDRSAQGRLGAGAGADDGAGCRARPACARRGVRRLDLDVLGEQSDRPVPTPTTPERGPAQGFCTGVRSGRWRPRERQFRDPGVQLAKTPRRVERRLVRVSKIRMRRTSRSSGSSVPR